MVSVSRASHCKLIIDKGLGPFVVPDKKHTVLYSNYEIQQKILRSANTKSVGRTHELELTNLATNFSQENPHNRVPWAICYFMQSFECVVSFGARLAGVCLVTVQ